MSLILAPSLFDKESFFCSVFLEEESEAEVSSDSAVDLGSPLFVLPFLVGIHSITCLLGFLV